MAKHLVAVILLALQSIHTTYSLIVASSQLQPRDSNFALQLSSSSLDERMTSQQKVVLVVGSCGLDRLLTVPSYPRADSKVLSTAYHEIGGGNAANTASAMALISNASIFSDEHFCIKLLTKVGDDYIGQQLKDELEKSGVDTSYVCRGEKGSTTSFTSIIVSKDEATRTCIHSMGTSGNFDANDIQSLDELFANVVHLHSDSRLAEVSLVLAKEARERNIPVSVDIEKDRKVPSLDELLVLADTVFTNSTQVQDYLERWTVRLESEHNRRPLPEPIVSVVGDDKHGIKETCALGIVPSHFFQRWYSKDPTRTKEVVITKGHMGALHVSCDSSLSTHGEELSPLHEVVACDDSSNDKVVNVQQRLVESDKNGETWTMEYKYNVHHTGVIADVHVVDTTGAGDAFIGGFILTQLLTQPPKDSIQFGLEFGAWVGGKKLAGPGARSALPSGSDADKELGRTTEEVQDRLHQILRPFAVDIT